MNKLNVSIQFVSKNNKHHRECLARTTLLRWVRAAIFSDAQITLRFVDAEEGQLLNRDYRNKNYATNVLTFAYTEPEEVAETLEATVPEEAHKTRQPMMADIVLCCPVIEKEAQEQNKTLEAHYAHLIIHGVLHAQGYDHETDAEANIMEALEIKIMQKLGFDNPYTENAHGECESKFSL